MKLFLALAAIAAVGAPIAHAQDGQASAAVADTAAPTAQPDSPTLTLALAPAIVAPAPAATGWTGPVNFSPVAVAELIIDVCRASVTGDGGDLTARAMHLGLGAPGPAHDDLSRALPPGAVTWRVPTVDGIVFLFGYGEQPLSCGAAILRPLSEDGFNKVTALLQDPKIAFTSDSTQILQGEVRWERLKSAKGEFIDVMEYPAKEDRPGILRADYLPG